MVDTKHANSISSSYRIALFGVDDRQNPPIEDATMMTMTVGMVAVRELIFIAERIALLAVAAIAVSAVKLVRCRNG